MIIIIVSISACSFLFLAQWIFLIPSLSWKCGTYWYSTFASPHASFPLSPFRTHLNMNLWVRTQCNAWNIIKIYIRNSNEKKMRASNKSLNVIVPYNESFYFTWVSTFNFPCGCGLLHWHYAAINNQKKINGD